MALESGGRTWCLEWDVAPLRRRTFAVYEARVTHAPLSLCRGKCKIVAQRLGAELHLEGLQEGPCGWS